MLPLAIIRKLGLKPRGSWLIQGEPLDDNRAYRVAINDFLISDREQNLGFLTLDAPGVQLIEEKQDIRFVVIRQLRAQGEPTAERVPAW